MGRSLHDLCKQIIETDHSIRFVGIPNKFGKKIVSHYRNGLVPLLTEYESELYAVESVLRMNTRMDMESKLGKPIYSFTLYEKVKRATILLENKDHPIMMISFDITSKHEDIILNKIMPLIKNIFSK